jgi:predicted O-methyltransferase YrrM
MSDIVLEGIEEYAERHTTPHTELLARLADETRATMSSPQMLSSPVAGRFLQFLVSMTRPQRVLELGTFTGYSSISMAAALPPGGRIDTCDVEEAHASVARRYIEEAGLSDRISIHLGPATETIESLDGQFDFVFIDADKANYVNYYEAVLPRLSDGGLIAADNTLWSGRVLDEEDDSDGTVAIRSFNEHVLADERVVSVMLTIRDGVTLIRRA